MKVPEFILKEAYNYSKNLGDPVTLAAGTFVKPIDPYWLPKHIKDSDEFKWYGHTHKFCYCSIGIIPIPADLIRELT